MRFYSSFCRLCRSRSIILARDNITHTFIDDCSWNDKFLTEDQNNHVDCDFITSAYRWVWLIIYCLDAEFASILSTSARRIAFHPEGDHIIFLLFISTSLSASQFELEFMLLWRQDVCGILISGSHVKWRRRASKFSGLMFEISRAVSETFSSFSTFHTRR